MAVGVWIIRWLVSVIWIYYAIALVLEGWLRLIETPGKVMLLGDRAVMAVDARGAHIEALLRWAVSDLHRVLNHPASLGVETFWLQIWGSEGIDQGYVEVWAKFIQRRYPELDVAVTEIYGYRIALGEMAFLDDDQPGHPGGT